MIKVKVIFGSYLAKETGKTEAEVSLKEDSSIMDMAREIGNVYGEDILNMLIDKERECFKILSFVNGKVCRQDRILNDNDTVNLLPPLAGG